KPSLTGVGDEHLAAEIIRGRDPRELALQVLRARLGDRRIELLDVATAEPAAPDAARVPVRWGEHDLGLLEADGVSPADLQRHADWLAAWLRLDQQHRDLRDAAYRDPLTGAWNRRYFDRFFDAALAKSRDGRHNLTLLVFDIDDFKVYNDRYGHGAGDEILIETVRLLQSVVRPTDRVCRIGGDEFAVVFYEPTGPRETGSRHPTSFFAISKRFQQQIWDHRFPKLGPQAPGTLTISGGLATYPWDGVTTQQLLERADRLALDSKRLGKNAITLGPGAMRACGGGE
ncbi:MAG: GGDEF domain-containing protein, partial [Phycisphaerales bacterium]